MPGSLPSSAARIEIAQPRLFTARAVLVVCAYGIFLCLPVFVSVLAMSLHWVGLLSLLYPFLVLCATVYFLPFGFGNSYVARLVRSLNPDAGPASDAFIVQLSLSPRLRSGIRAIVEDADDIGRLRVAGPDLVFQGDSVTLSIPFDQIKTVRLQNIGVRGLFAYPCIALAVPGLPNVESVIFAERSTCLLPAARRRTKHLYERLSSRLLPGAKGQTDS